MTPARPPAWIALAELLGPPEPALSLPPDPGLAELTAWLAADSRTAATIETFTSNTPRRRDRRGGTMEPPK